MAKAKKMTLRQRLRADAEKRLDELLNRVYASAEGVTAGTSVPAELLMQLASQPTQGKTLRHDLITKLANDIEDELERIYNNQMKPPGVDDE